MRPDSVRGAFSFFSRKKSIMHNMHSSLTEGEIHKLMASQAYRQSTHPEHYKTHTVVREWFVNRYNAPEKNDKSSLPAGSPWQDLGNVLLVGEGNLSFAKSLLADTSSGITGMIATTYEGKRSLPDEAQINAKFLRSHGAVVMHNIDATHLENEFESQKFDTIVFQFPNVGSREPVHGRNPNYILLRKFLRSASAILKPAGKVIVSTVDSSHYEGAFQFEDATQFAGFEPPESYPFDPSAFPGYSHVNTNDDDSAIEEHRKFLTRVFRLKT